jgi:predicted transcriptional regulator of viral defense system
MADKRHPDALGLHRLAYGQDGYFTARQARECGFSAQLLDHHLRSGRYERMRRGLYRLRGYPGSSHEQVRASWLVVGAGRAVVSHESALELHELSDVLPDAVHLLVDHRHRGIKPPVSVRIHTTATPLSPGEVMSAEGIRVTSPERAIIDAAATGTQPEQIEMAVRQSLEQGVATERGLRERSQRRGRRVEQLIGRALDHADAA